MVKDPALDVSKIYSLGEMMKQLEQSHRLFIFEEGWWWKILLLNCYKTEHAIKKKNWMLGMILVSLDPKDQVILKRLPTKWGEKGKKYS